MITPSDPSESGSALRSAPRGALSGYGKPSPSYHRPLRKPRNGVGKAALVLAVMGLGSSWLWGVGAIVALAGLVCGAVGLRRTSHGIATNRGVAMGGVVLSVIAIVLSLAWVVYLAWFLSMAGECVNLEQFPTREAQQHCFEQRLHIS